MAIRDEVKPPEDPAIVESRVEEFAERVLGDLAASTSTVFSTFGDRLGLFRALTAAPATCDQLASRAELDERYVREWASGLVAAGYLTNDADSRRFSLPPEHAAVLADEGGPAFMGGAPQFVAKLLSFVDPVEKAFRQGGGVSLDRYGDAFWSGLTRLTGVSFDHQSYRSGSHPFPVSERS